MFDPQETIAAIATAPGGAARGVVRVSGPNAIACVAKIFTPCGGESIHNIRRATAIDGELTLPDFASSAPCYICIWPDERSYTRQPTVEIHTVGATPLLEVLLEELCQHGARLAQPGEFTMRAFLAGRIDLTQAEAVLGVIDARDGRRLETALEQLAGGLSGPLAALREELLDLLSHLEAGLDFVEEDIEFISADQLQRQLADIEQQAARIAEQMRTRTVSDQAPRVALVGAPNVGKSSLFNALTGGADALVCDTPGVTRDYLVAPLNIDGLQVVLIDTAGQDTAADAVTAAAQQQTEFWRDHADIVLRCYDANEVSEHESIAKRPTSSDLSQIIVFTKSDRLPQTPDSNVNSNEAADEAASPNNPESICYTSSLTGDGLSDLTALIRAKLLQVDDESSVVAATASRCGESLRRAVAAIHSAKQLTATGAGEELIAAELRVALEELGHVVGAVVTDDILDRIFSRFCIGK